ncbi:hypothetical protein [Bacteroides sp.]
MIMKMENEMKYVAPEVLTLEVEIETGFAGSVETGGTEDIPMD